MDQNGQAVAYPVSTSQELMTYPHESTSQNAFDIWSNGCQTYTAQDHMQWLTNGHGHYPLLNEGYQPNLQHSYSDPVLASTESHQNSLPQYQQPSIELVPTSNYPSQIFTTSASPIPSTQSLDGLMPLDSNHVGRLQSAETMLESGSTTTSRKSSISSSPINHTPKKIKVPAIRTHFDNFNSAAALDDTPLIDGFQVAPDTDGMTAMSNEWMRVHDSSDQHGLNDQSLSAISVKASSALLEPFQWHPAPSRRPSITSAASGPLFSPYGTPGSVVWQQSNFNSPYPQQQIWTPVSGHPSFANSPQSPYHQRKHETWNGRTYSNAMRQNRANRPSASTLPSRRPRLPNRNLTDSTPLLQSQFRPRSIARPRGSDSEQSSTNFSQQLALPPFHPGLFHSPNEYQTEFTGRSEVQAQTPTRNTNILPSSGHTPMGPPQTTPRIPLTPNFNSLQLNTPLSSQPFPHLPTNVPSSTLATNPIQTPAHQPPLPVPSDPPLSDFLGTSSTASNCTSSPGNGHSHNHSHNHPPACAPIRQSPHFEGDIYTPRFKRRNAAGKWEGWCGYCQPGRWLDLKNSRYWEDKLRNHGICARTKTFFEGPVRVRWVSDRGTVWEGEAGDSGFDLKGIDNIEDDGVGRKREGLCGECNVWVGMDGMRSRGKGRCVAWWMHAYKCHEQSRSRTDGAGGLDQV